MFSGSGWEDYWVWAGKTVLLPGLRSGQTIYNNSEKLSRILVRHYRENTQQPQPRYEEIRTGMLNVLERRDELELGVTNFMWCKKPK